MSKVLMLQPTLSLRLTHLLSSGDSRGCSQRKRCESTDPRGFLGTSPPRASVSHLSSPLTMWTSEGQCAHHRRQCPHTLCTLTCREDASSCYAIRSQVGVLSQDGSYPKVRVLDYIGFFSVYPGHVLQGAVTWGMVGEGASSAETFPQSPQRSD